MCRPLLVALALLAAPFAIAQQAVTAALHKHVAQLVIENGALSGAAAEVLDRELATAQFILIGEDHGMQETGRFTTALLPRAWKNGFRHYVVEVGPMTVERLVTQSRGREPMDAIVAWNRKYPFTMPFLGWREDAEAFATAVRLSGGRADAVWGIDQEFYFSATPHLDRLAALAKSTAAKQAVAALHDQKLTSAGIESLRVAFARSGESAEARRLIDELAESWKIYDLYFAKQYYENNLTRSVLMKRHFFAAYDAARRAGEAMPKAVIKFGSTHMVRGRSFTNIFDIGSLLPELATRNGSHTFSLLILPRGGRVNAFRPGGEDADKASPYEPEKALGGKLAPLFDAAPADGWTLIDLRAARPELRDVNALDARLVQILFGYDAVLVVPQATPSTIIE